MELHDPPLKFVELVVRTVRAFTRKVSVGHWPCSDEIAPLTVDEGVGEAAAWLTVTVWVATVSVALRGDAPV
jgi:hypothetical protein